EQSLMKGDKSQLTIETTSNGIGNKYYELFMSAYKGNSKYRAMFIPFFHELYKKQFKNDHDEAEKWFKLDNKGKRLSVAELEPDEKVLHDMCANLRLVMWRRYKLLDMDLHDFQQEYASNPMESFISTGLSVFDQSKVLERLGYVIPSLEKKDVQMELSVILKR